MTALDKFKKFIFSDNGSLKEKALRSGFWLGISGALIQFLSIFRSIILARLLTPEMFGLIGICMILTRGIETFTRPGFVAALIHRKHDVEEAKYTVFTLLSARGIFLAVLIFSVSPFMASFYDDEIIQAMLMFMSINFILTGFTNINTVLQQKNLNFRKLAYLDQTVSILSTIIAITAAFYYRSVWSLVIAYVANGFLQLIFSYILIPGKVGFKWNQKIAKELFSYGKYVTASAMVLYFATEIDSALIGKIIGITELGYYVLAFTTANMATTYISKMLSRIMFPAYSKLQDKPEALRTAYINVFSMVVVITVPIATTIIFFAPQLMVAVYGEQWLPAAEPLIILSIFGIIRSVSSLTGFFLNGVGRPEIGFRNSLVRLVLLSISIYPLIIYFGLEGAAIAVTFAIGIQSLLGIRGVMTIIQLETKDLLVQLYPQFIKLIIILATYFIFEMYFDTYDILNLVFIILAGATLYSILSYRYLLNLFHNKL